MRQYQQKTGEGAFSILTVDDDPIMTSTIQAYFQRSGYRVAVENDPSRAIERIRQEHFDILLLDFLMTPICGDQVVEQVRQFNQDLFIILLTGHKSMVPPIKTIRALDIQGYYEKSDRFDQLELLVESCAKSIRQMKTIKTYKDGLATIMDSLPLIYDLQSMDRISDSILRTASSLLPCISVVLTLDAAQYPSASQQGEQRQFISRAVGEYFAPMDPQQSLDTLQTLEHQSPLIQDKQITFPILNHNQKPMGFLSIVLKTVPKYDQIQLMAVFARQASSAVCNAQLHTLVQEKNVQLDQAYGQLKNDYLEMVRTMRRVVDAKDTYTRGHSDRVSYYGFHIARRLGRSQQYCEQVRLAGLFHDIGKLSVPDEILLKTSPLTDEEYEVIKTHSRNGVDILNHITQFQSILPAVLSHHERMDGLGYPDGIRGEEIPEIARIIAVADSFDAMTSDRQYRKSLGFHRAMDELERGKGTQFDPVMAQTLIQLLGEQSFLEHMRSQIHDCAPYISTRD